MENFNLSYAKQLSTESFTQCKEYITKYFYPLTTGQHIYVEYVNDKPVYNITDPKVIKSVYFNRLSKEINAYYFTEYTGIKQLVCELNKPLLFDNKINTCPSMMHDAKPYNTFSPDIKAKVQTMLKYVKESWANNKDDQFKFIIQWIANMTRGNKNQSLLYLKGPEGIGKSTFTDFLVKHVIGSRLSLKSGSQPLLSQFNSILFCKLLVVYEEIENFGATQWQTVSTRIKRDITSDTCQYESKGVDSFEGKNINNVIINTNVDAIKDDNGRRIFCLDLSTKRTGDKDFWKMIYRDCMNDEVGEAFYNYLLEFDISDYFDQAFPDTEMKSDSIIKRLDNISRFLKEKYILEKRDLKTSLKELFTEYTDFCISIGSRAMTKIDLNKKLNDLGLTGFKSGNIAVKFTYTNEYLLGVAKKYKWLHVTDQFELTGDEIFGDNINNKIDQDNLDKNIDQDKCDDLQQQKIYIQQLEKRITELENINHFETAMNEMLQMKPIKIKPIKIKPITEDEFNEDLDLLLEMC